MDASEIDKAIVEFGTARARGEYFPRAWADRLSIDDAYRIQLGLIRDRCAQTGQRRIGWKVGLTARAIQQQFGFDDTVVPQMENAILAGHDIILLGERGQDKTRVIRSMVGLLDEWLSGVPGEVFLYYIRRQN